MILNEIKTDIKSMREQENEKAKIAKLEALLDYVCIMADIELFDENEVIDNEQEF